MPLGAGVVQQVTFSTCSLARQQIPTWAAPAPCLCPPWRSPAPDFAAAARRRYLAARLALCRFACQHQQTLAALLVAEVALCCAWLALWLLRGRVAAEGSEEEEQERCYEHGGRLCWAPAGQPQFLIASAADPQWHAELKQPLLPRRDDTAGSSPSCC